jgi:chitodextrinase
VKNSTINTFGSECFEVKENAHHNRLENSDCGFNDEPLSFKGSNVELRGDHNLVLNSRVSGSRSWNVKLMSDAPAYDLGGNAVQKSSFGGAAGAAIHNEQSTAGSSHCGNTFATSPAADGAPSIGNPAQPCPDTTAPTAPTGLTARAASATSVALSWTAATDDVGVTAYGVLRGGVQVGTTSALTYTDSGLTASTAYSYTVVARDAVGNTSPPSAVAPVTTPAPPTTAPPTTAPPTTAPPATAQPIVKEAEAGTVTSPMAVRTDSAAQGGRYVSQTSGSSAGKDTVSLTVPTAGRYAVALRVIAPNSSSDSFVVKVGSGAATTWSLGTRASWTWVTGPTVQLAAGTTTVVVTNRENGARLDAVRLTPVP